MKLYFESFLHRRYQTKENQNMKCTGKQATNKIYQKYVDESDFYF